MSGLFFFLLSFALNSFANTCEELPVGSGFPRNLNEEQSLTKVEQKYFLYRESVDTYEVMVNPYFMADSRSTESEMKKKVASCLVEHSEVMNKKSDIKLNFKVFDKELDLQKTGVIPPVVHIGIKNPKTRADSHSYPIDVDCLTVYHEVLHLTGLVDEYEEIANDRSYYPARAIGPANSIMSNMGTVLVFGIRTSSKLYPAHIKHILYPECIEKNETYYTCAKYAYDKQTKKKLDICKNKGWIK